MTAVEIFKVDKRQPHYKAKLRASSTMKKGMDVIRAYRISNFGPLDPEVDPASSGMIGKLITPVTSLMGHLESKRTTVNPNWGAVLVEMLKKAGAKRGDLVAVGFSGSFPALNLAVLAAAKGLGLRVLAISSASASAWGANLPELTWLDMERILYEKGIINTRSVAASLGGLKDRAVGMSKRGRELLKEAIERAGARLIFNKDLDDSIDHRMAIYREFAGDTPIAVYVNVGGGTVSVGTRMGKMLFRPGLTKRARRQALLIDSIMTRFAREGVPVIHLSQIKKLAARYGIPEAPNRMARVGKGAIFVRSEYSLWLAAGLLALISLALYLFIKIDVGYRIFSSKRPSSGDGQPKQMV
jgi:poly-gamma-glutamate system protein